MKYIHCERKIVDLFGDFIQLCDYPLLNSKPRQSACKSSVCGRRVKFIQVSALSAFIKFVSG